MHEAGGIFESADMMVGAEEAFRFALELDPGHVDAMYNLGTTLYHLERHEEAAETFRDTLQMRPG